MIDPRRIFACIRPVLAIAFAAVAAQGTEYFLSPMGDDKDPGTREAPWRTVAKANEALRPGDSAVFLPGEYAGTIAPANSGTPGAPITYRSAEFRAAHLLRPTADSQNSLILLVGREHVIVDGFLVQPDPPRSAHWLRARGSNHVTIRGCRMRAARLTAVDIVHCTQVRLMDNLFSADRNSGGMVNNGATRSSSIVRTRQAMPLSSARTAAAGVCAFFMLPTRITGLRRSLLPGPGTSIGIRWSGSSTVSPRGCP